MTISLCHVHSLVGVTHQRVVGNGVALLYLIHMSFVGCGCRDAKERHKGRSSCSRVHVAPAHKQ